MILFPHMLVGAALGAKIHSFWAVFTLGFVLHFITDMIPHWDYVDSFKEEIKNSLFKLILKGAADLLIGASIIVVFAWGSQNLPYVLTGMLASILPDFIIVGYIFCREKLGWNIGLLNSFCHLHKKAAYQGIEGRQFQEILYEAGFAILFFSALISLI